jgi:hypothetical protein
VKAHGAEINRNRVGKVRRNRLRQYFRLPPTTEKEKIEKINIVTHRFSALDNVGLIEGPDVLSEVAR